MLLWQSTGPRNQNSIARIIDLLEIKIRNEVVSNHGSDYAIPHPSFGHTYPTGHH